MTIVCPHCRIVSHFMDVWSDHVWLDNETGETQRYCWTCDNCGLPISGIESQWANQPSYWPQSLGGKDFPDVPQSIASAANEAHLCLSADASRAAVAMARAVVEATAKDKGITTGNIVSKINKLAEQGHISEAMREAAHEIRLAGNESAHGDLTTEPLGAEDAKEIVSLMDAILERVYQEPAKVARVRANREARRQAAASKPVDP